MQVILQGSLRHFAVAELLAFLCRQRETGERSGTLDLESSGQRARILFQQGRVVWVESSAAGDPVEAVVAALAWDEGSFTLLDSIAVPEHVTPISMTVEEIQAEASRRAEEKSGYPDAAVFRMIDDPALQQQISLTPEEFKILFRVAAGKTFGELLADVPAPRAELVLKLRRLEGLGLVAVARAQDAEPARTAPQKRTTASRKRTLVGSLTPDGASDRVFPLLEAQHTIGRAAECGITIPDASVSSQHATIVRTAQGFVLEDLRSRNGTFVNGERLTEKRLLCDGDLIRIGRVILIFNLARESKAGDVTQPGVRLA